jgi:hypothetical protein
MMPSSLAAELLIRIAADPSNAESNLARFRALMTRDLGQVNSLLGRSQQAAAAWRAELQSNFAEVANASQTLADGLLARFSQFNFALGANTASAIIWQQSIGEAFRRASLQAIGAMAQEAIVRALQSTALGFYLLAIQDFRGAALAFKSAALFGAVGGAAALAGRALAAETREPESGRTERTELGSPAQSAGAARGQTSASGEPQRTVQIIFQGPVYGGQAGVDELVRHISQAVTERDVNLVAYTVVRQPATRA